MTTSPEQLRKILEAAIMAAGRPLTVADMQKLFDEADQPSAKDIRDILTALQEQYANNGIELRELASGYQFQARVELSPWLSKLWEERPPRYSRALLETLALIAYRQPITRAEIEEIRGVTVSSNIIKTLQEREWIRVIGYRDVPGKPALYATTKTFLDHLNLKTLDELPSLAEIIDLESQEEKLQVQLELATIEDTEIATEAAQEQTPAAEMTEAENVDATYDAAEEHFSPEEVETTEEHVEITLAEEELTLDEIDEDLHEEISDEIPEDELDPTTESEEEFNNN